MAFLFQYIGVVGILGYIGSTEGIDQITKSPLWLLFMLTSILLAYLQLSVSIDVEEGEKEIKLPLITSLFYALFLLELLLLLFISFSVLKDLYLKLF